MKIIGITGGIGSGKSWLAEKLRGESWAVWDADEENRAILQEPYFIAQLLELPWTMAEREVLDFLDGQEGGRGISRRKLAEIIFARPEIREVVEKLTWDYLRENLAEWLQKVETESEKVAFVVAPLLFEAGWEKLMDEVWVIVADENVRRERVKRREPDLLESELNERWRRQLTDEERIKRADVVLHNDRDNQEMWDFVKAQFCKFA